MWWEKLIVALLVAAASLWLAWTAVRRIRRVLRGGGCPSDACGSAKADASRATTGPRELLQVGLKIERKPTDRTGPPSD